MLAVIPRLGFPKAALHKASSRLGSYVTVATQPISWMGNGCCLLLAPSHHWLEIMSLAVYLGIPACFQAWPASDAFKPAVLNALSVVGKRTGRMQKKKEKKPEGGGWHCDWDRNKPNHSLAQIYWLPGRRL